MTSQVRRRTTLGVQFELELSSAALHRALGPTGTPASLVFGVNTLMVSTPMGAAQLRGRSIMTAGGGDCTSGIRAGDADALRDATEGPDATVSFVASPLAITLVNGSRALTIGRW